MANEKRLIDANELETVFRETRISSVFPNWRNMDILAKVAVIEYAKEVKRIVTGAPTVDVVEVVQGMWLWYTEDIYTCSNCYEKVHVKEVMGQPDYHYCPNCGANMMDGG